MNSLLQFFAWQRSSGHLQVISKPFGELGREMAATLLLNAESTASIRKLLAAKECGVRVASRSSVNNVAS